MVVDFGMWRVYDTQRRGMVSQQLKHNTRMGWNGFDTVHLSSQKGDNSPRMVDKNGRAPSSDDDQTMTAHCDRIRQIGGMVQEIRSS